jgi:hypothetical protein
MFTLVPLIVDRLRAALGIAWHVSDGLALLDRRPLQRAEVLMLAPSVEKTSGVSLTLKPGYAVQLVASTQDIRYEQLDAAFDAVIRSLHFWRPGACRVDRLQLSGARDMQFKEQELFGFELVFTTVTTRQGCNE